MRPEYLNFLFSGIDNLRGIGKKTLENYSRLLNKKRRLSTFGHSPLALDLLYHLPEKILARQRVNSVGEIAGNGPIIAKVKIVNHIPPQSQKSPYRILCYLGNDFVYIIYYKSYQNWLRAKFPPGKEITISGKVDFFDSQTQITQPDYIDDGNGLNIPVFAPAYQLTLGVTNKEISENVKMVLENLPKLAEWIPEEILRKNNWTSWGNSLIGLHAPRSCFDAKNNPFKRRLVFDEFLARQLSLMIVRKTNLQRMTKDELPNREKTLQKKFLKKLQFELTNDQKEAMREIESDAFSPTKMNRLLQGDVGSGKTIVAFLCALNYVENGKQTALIVPTSLLATQHYENLTKLCRGEEINIELLTGKTKAAQKRRILDNLKNGKINLLIGTHALIEENVEFYDLRFVIIDEQQRFGVEQRLSLISKNKNADVLSMTATPIPRTMALTLCSDMELTVIREKPANRQNIKTSVVSMGKYEELLESLRKKFDADEKIFWICPLAEESEKIDLINVKARYGEFCKIFGEDRVSFAHGKMKEKDSAMEEFVKNDRKKILIATTVVEVGIDARAATVMVIEHPERFGLSQLHQLRGRVGRNDKESFCILLYDHKNIGQKSLKRLLIIRETNDGFRIAEEDLKLRGVGEILGVRQSGDADFLIANLNENMDLLMEANALAKKIADSGSAAKYKDLLYLFDYANYFDRDILN
ncbi:MAG: ATP-dependent DNA helicase RecG [Rickettsiales bacterium]|jgi:ATP-dependent DNA helicase RecG|nr:ATP-dependent DNA helicase RecG [Rickettsiales bacterium]